MLHRIFTLIKPFFPIMRLEMPEKIIRRGDWMGKMKKMDSA